MGWRDVWAHQLRWARTIRVCQPVPWFFSILSNAMLWPLAWLFCTPFLVDGQYVVFVGNWHRVFELIWDRTDDFLVVLSIADLQTQLLTLTGAVVLRLLSASDCQCRLTVQTTPRRSYFLPPVKDIISVFIWALSFLGNTVTWRGVRYRVRRGGKLEKL